MKAGSRDPTISELDCIAANILLKGSFVPDSWQRCIDVMISKKLGVTLLSGLYAIVLLPVDYYYVLNSLALR
jgi:hypothetical protein